MQSIDIETILTIIFVLVDDGIKAMAKNQGPASPDVDHLFQTVRS
ncbi:MAG: hypothetical protein WAS33_28470 [Candidatus Promineifilaceae bacterium]